jgi:hypothetical protein
MGFGDFNIGGSGGPTITNHAKEQWRDRAPRAGQLTESTWLNADPVIAPEANCDESRVVYRDGARDMLLCGKHNRDGLSVVTVLYADHDRIR